MANNDIQVMRAGDPIKNFGIVVLSNPTGQTLDSRVNASTTIASIEEKYENRFTDQETELVRHDSYFDVSIAAGDSVSEGFSVATYSFGSFEVKSAFTGPTLNFEGKMRDSAMWETIQDSAGTALTGVPVTTGTVIAIPSVAMHSDMLRFAAASGQAADCSINVLLKG